MGTYPYFLQGFAILSRLYHHPLNLTKSREIPALPEEREYLKACWSQNRIWGTTSDL